MSQLATLDDAQSLGFDPGITEADLKRATARIYSVMDNPVEMSDNKRLALVDLVCSIADRLVKSAKSEAAQNVASGITQDGVGPFTQSYGFDAYRASSGLSAGEISRLRSIFPAMPKLHLTGYSR